MKKRLLFAALAMTCAIGSFAYEEGDYAYTKSGRVKMTGANLISNGNLVEDFKDWTGATEEAPNSNAWGIEPGVGPNGENAIKSKGVQSDEGGLDNALCQVIQLVPGTTYVASFQIQAPEGTSGATSVGTTIGNNYADIFLNTDGAKTRAESTVEAPVGAVATSINFNADWTSANFFFEVADSTNAPTFLVIRFEKMATDVQITNISVNEAVEVYDIRKAEQKIAWAKTVADIPEFNTSDAASARANLLDETIPAIEAMIESGEIDDNGDDIVPQLDEKIAEYLDCSSKNLKSMITGIDISTLGYAGRGRTITGLGSAEAGGVWLEGGNWGHLTPADGEEEYLMAAIQKGNWTVTAKYCVANSIFPAGKYFFTAEIRNASTSKSSWPCADMVFDLNTTCQISLGDVTQDIENVYGEEYKRVYIIADVTTEGGFTANIYWPGNGNNGAFFIRNPEVRTFDFDVEEKAAHVAAFKEFITQYNAAVGARNTIVSLQRDKYYPWSKDSLQLALDTYDPYFHITDGWVTEDGQDAGVATTEQLSDWAKYQGGEIPEDEKATYYVVRGYQKAITVVREANKAITDLSNTITKAYELAGDAMFQNGDKATFLVAITKAQNILRDILADANDASREADEVTLAEALTTLNEDIEIFKESNNLLPIVDIDFSQKAETSDETTYVIKGEAGEMTFTAFQPDNSINDYNFAQGVDVNGETVLGDVLHVGGDSYGEVILPGEVTEEDALRINFDFWFGQLGSAYQYIDLMNVNGERVAGFSIDAYKSNVEYNEFDNEEGTGMVIKGKIKSNHDKNGGAASVCTEALKNSFELTVDYSKMTVQGTLTNTSNNVVGIEIPIKSDEGFDNKITAFRVGGRNHTKANSGAFGRRAWFDNLKIYQYTVVSSVIGDVNRDNTVDVADISAIITVMAAGTNDKTADVNGDGTVDVADISSVITIMANK